MHPQGPSKLDGSSSSEGVTESDNVDQRNFGAAQKVQKKTFARSVKKTQLLPASHTRDSSSTTDSGAIIDQALSVVLNVVTDISESSTEAEVPIVSRKIAKKRRKENDEDGLSSSIHHSTSCKEYLRKVQESLRRNRSEPCSSDTESSNEDQPVPTSRDGNPALQPVRNIRRPRNLTTRQIQPDNSNKEATSNLYGYEDPDAASASRTTSNSLRRPYHRRGSVTKFSIQAAQAAIRKFGAKACSSDWVTTASGALLQQYKRKEEGCHGNPYRYADATPDRKKYGYGAAPPDSNKYGYGDATADSSKYGYEDATPNSEVYGYGGPEQKSCSARLQQPHRRATRRGSVTKFSLSAAQVVASNQPPPSEVESRHHKSFDQRSFRDTEPASQVPSQQLQPGAEIAATAANSSPQGDSTYTRPSQPKSCCYDDKKPCDPLHIDSYLSDSEESSDIDSVASFGDVAEESLDLPARPPRRMDSIESDASSLAPDLRSRCSISRTTD